MGSKTKQENQVENTKKTHQEIQRTKQGNNIHYLQNNHVTKTKEKRKHEQIDDKETKTAISIEKSRGRKQK